MEGGKCLEAIYFNKKCIDLSKINKHTENPVISLLNMEIVSKKLIYWRFEYFKKIKGNS